ncbi:uncharacterized protein LOC135810088 [Sycon ciliatum]|uniref:uncharacterized protein LOC135810088 n=1 Tax=Sycon ciliatum TaxID=27933 RepID=UPI0031F67150
MALAASAPLCVPQSYDPSFQVDVCLDDSLRASAVLSDFFLAEFFSRLSLLDIVLRKHIQLSKAQKNVDKASRLSMGSHLSQAQELSKQLDEMVEELNLPAPLPLQDFISEMELADIMPNALSFVQNSCKEPGRLYTSRLDYYLTEVNMLHQLHSMSSMIAQEVALGQSQNQKYLAHQVVILYTLIKQLGPDMAAIRSSLEANFDNLKTACSSGCGRMPEKLATWLTKLCTSLESVSLNLPEQCNRFQHLQHVYQAFETQWYMAS